MSVKKLVLMMIQLFNESKDEIFYNWKYDQKNLVTEYEEQYEVILLQYALY
ncbi:MAG TPA: hypothetical protein PKD85_11630 [Saprospiraceae bacterium]|nr:hypothetical protein [Saprospiraceae bacterium]